MNVFQVQAKVPITFPTLGSYIKYSTTTGNVVNVEFEFRTYDTDGLLFFHETGAESYVKVRITPNKTEPLVYCWFFFLGGGGGVIYVVLIWEKVCEVFRCSEFVFAF